ncbi:MAG: proline iminopeptidase [Methylophilaceae bacterium]|jgi:proline iminopeptidase
MCHLTYNLYPEIEPYNTNWLKTDDLHEIYYEESGNLNGKPIVFLHGGPGSGCNPGQRRFFDPTHYRIILLDQRGCGRSRPQGSLTNNTTADLVDDLEALRYHLNVETWHVFGGSWGSTLALAYATQHPQQVVSLTLRGIFLSRTSELNWFLGDIQHFYPEVWHTLLDYLPLNEQDDVLTAFEKRIASDDLSISHPAAIAWNNYEGSIMRLDPAAAKASASTKPTIKQTTATLKTIQIVDVARAQVQIHYVRNLCFIDGESILEATKKLSNIPTAIVQGRYDMVCPPQTSWLLSKAMPHAEYTIVQDAGHSAMEPGVISALVCATEKFKAL